MRSQIGRVRTAVGEYMLFDRSPDGHVLSTLWFHPCSLASFPIHFLVSKRIWFSQTTYFSSKKRSEFQAWWDYF